MFNTATLQDWQDSISCLPENKFFDIVRLYLGEIKTPYNKQRLIEQLAGFIKNDSNQKNIISLLDEFDIKILCVIALISDSTRDTIVDFFKSEYSMADIYTALSNLCMRLVLFIQKDKFSNKEFYRITPLLWDNIKPYINTKHILCNKEKVSTNIDDVFVLSPNFIMSFISFIRMNGCSTKSDGTIKKNDLNRIEMIFPGRAKIVQLLLNAFINLSLIKEGPKSFEIDDVRFEMFSLLKESYQMALLCAASCSRFSKDGLKKESQLLLDCLSSIPDSGYTRSTILQLSFLVGANTSKQETSVPSRFSRMLEAARQESSFESAQVFSTIFDRMIDSAIEFGLLKNIGKTEDAEEIYISGITSEESKNDFTKVLSLDSTYTVTLMPGLSLNQLLPLSNFLGVKTCKVVTEFEISRKSVSVAFDNGFTPESVIEQIKKYTNYEIPQNLDISIRDWYNSYSSALIYQGYVLKVTENNINFVENNPKIRKLIKEKLAEGIYLLNIPIDSDVSLFFQDSGLEFLGKIKNPNVDSEKIPFPLLKDGNSISFDDSNDSVKIDFSSAAQIIKEVKSEFEKMDLSKNMKESYMNRISNRLIISKEQLLRAYIRTEILEADGMDFSGKLHLLEAAVKDNDLVELKLPSTVNEGEFINIVGHPLGVFRQTNEAILRFQPESTNDIDNLLVGKITHVKRLKF